MLAPAMATTALILLLVLSSSPAVVAWKDSGLSVGFYRELCPKAEKVVRRVVTKAFKKEPGTPGDIIRLFFHDCFVRVSRSLMFTKFEFMMFCTAVFTRFLPLRVDLINPV